MPYLHAMLRTSVPWVINSEIQCFTELSLTWLHDSWFAGLIPLHSLRPVLRNRAAFTNLSEIAAQLSDISPYDEDPLYIPRPGRPIPGHGT